MGFRIVQISPDLSRFRGCVHGLVYVRLAEFGFGGEGRDPLRLRHLPLRGGGLSLIRGRRVFGVYVEGVPVFGFGGIVRFDPRYGGGPVVQASDVRQGVVAFVEFGAAAGAFGHTLAAPVAADVAEVPVVLDAKVSTAGESDG